jgi:hypothetical protein
MADERLELSSVTLLDNKTYYFEDEIARQSIFTIDGFNTSRIFSQWWDLSDNGVDTKYQHLEKFFAMLARSWAGKKYTLQYYKPSVSSSPVMTPVDDLEGKSAAQLCTDATSPVEDWADNDPMTWYVRANALSLADGTMNILAIEGLDDDFDLTGETAPVWTFSMALWKKEWELGDYKYKSWATTQLDEYYKPYAGDVDPNTNKKRIMTWRPTFPGSLTADGTKLTSGVGGKPYLFVGAVTAITKARAMDAYEGLWNDADAIWVLDMWQLRHFNLENSGICEGCQSYNFQYKCAVGETGVKRVLLTAAQAGNLQVGSNLMIGEQDANTNNDRGQAYNRNIAEAATILSIEDVEVGGVAYKAVNVDTDNTFDTTTTTLVSTIAWSSGNTENLPGHKDGACHSLTAGQNPLRVQGVEMMSGANDIGLDPLYNVTNFANSKGDYAVYECRNSEKLAGSITADYEDTGISYAQMPQGWNYPKAFAETDKAVLFPAELGGSTSAYYKSGFSGAFSAGVRCPWRYGALGGGANAGLACEAGGNTPSNASWYGRPRLSGSGKKRGVWTA